MFFAHFIEELAEGCNVALSEPHLQIIEAKVGRVLRVTNNHEEDCHEIDFFEESHFNQIWHQQPQHVMIHVLTRAIANAMFTTSSIPLVSW